ncbi:hypothetical protein ACFXNW_25175 [Nocardia sp. NPDC059180]|uniref:hypothetical protein n=1 Tax=Nocardia sp. NPDC059180 TaxID=3346761 RepID=UPI0036C2D2D8
MAFRPKIGAAGITGVGVDMSHHSMNAPNDTIDGTPVIVERVLGCTITVPYRVRDFIYSMYGSEGADVCPAAKEFVRAALPTLDTTPLRSDTTRAFDTPLAAMDPCAALTVLGTDPDRLKIDTHVVAYNCEVQLDKDDESTYYSIISTQKTLSLLDYGQSEGEVITVSGVRAVRKPNSCTMDLYLGENDPRTVDIGADGPPPAHQGRADTWADVVELTGSRGCTDLMRIAEAVVTAYKSA